MGIKPIQIIRTLYQLIQVIGMTASTRFYFITLTLKCVGAGVVEIKIKIQIKLPLCYSIKKHRKWELQANKSLSIQAGLAL